MPIEAMCGHECPAPCPRDNTVRKLRRTTYLYERLADDLSADDGGALGPAIMQIGYTHMVEPQAPKNRGVQVVHVRSLLDGPQSDVVRAADNLAGLDAAARHPHTEAPRIMVATQIGRAS